MKFIVLSALICTGVGNNFAFSSPSAATMLSSSKVSPDSIQRMDAFEQQLTFHQRNINMLWHQYTLRLEQIANAKGSHAELNREEDHLTAGYKQDIKQRVRVAESKKAIEKIVAKYARKHARRDAVERQEITRLQELLLANLENEKRLFDASKKKYADVINDQTRSLLQRVEQRFSQLIARANALENSGSETIASH